MHESDRRKREKNIVLPGGDKERYYTVNDIISNSPEMIKIKDSISQVAQTDSSVLIYGGDRHRKRDDSSGYSFCQQEDQEEIRGAKLRGYTLQRCWRGILFGTVRGAFTGAEDHPGLSR